MRFLRKSLSGLFLLAITAGLLVWSGEIVRDALQERLSKSPKTPPARERVFSVNVTSVEARTLRPDLAVFGEVQSRRTLELRVATGGALTQLAPEFVEGGQVREGQILARIDPADAQAALERAQSALLDTRAEAREAERAIALAGDELAAARDQIALRISALTRQRDLAARNIGTAAAVEAAELALSAARQAELNRRSALLTANSRHDQAKRAIRRAEIAEAEAQRRLDETVIRAAFSGTLTDVAVVAGRLVSPNERLADLVDPDRLEVAFRVSTLQYSRLLGTDGTLREADVEVSLDLFDGNMTVSGRLSRDGAAVGEGQTGRLLFASLSQTRVLKPGDFVTVSLREPPLHNVARLPASALDGAGRVLVLGEQGRLEEAPVDLLRRVGNDVLIKAESLNGREVVSERTPLLGAGIKVKALRE